MTLTIPGNPATKKNSMRIVRCGPYPKIIPSKAFEDYQNAAAPYLMPARSRRITGPVNVKCLYYMRTRRKVDLGNLLAATCDILVRYGVLADDCSGIVESHDGSRVLYDKDNPRVEITITGGWGLV